MTLFQFSDYRAYLRDFVKRLPNGGRGEFTRMAKHLRASTTLLSQVLAGTRNLSEEQTYELSLYLGHNPVELEYFALLVQIERAGTANLRNHLEKKRKQIGQEAKKLTNRVAFQRELTEQERSIFYSTWIYSALHLFTSTQEKGVTLDDCAERFQLPRGRVNEIMQFLLEAGLVTQKQGRFTMSTQSTFVAQGSPHLLKHHANWRVKAVQKSENLGDGEMMYSGQFSLSRADFENLREQFAELLNAVNKTVKDSPAEEIACLNLDWFWIE